MVRRLNKTLIMKLSSSRIPPILLTCIIAAVITVIFPLVNMSEVHEPCQLPTSVVDSFVHIDGGGFIQGTHSVYPEEGPPKKVFVSSFLLQATEVTNKQFAEFVAQTGYVTDAEKGIGSAQFSESETPWITASWWKLDNGATWKTPDGEGSSLERRDSHPVVHVTLNDARAYAKWAGGRIPTETEWEYAASLGLFDPMVPESGMQAPDGTPRANIWTGTFPDNNTEEDGFPGTAPVGCFEQNLIGAYDMIGNVWEWTESRYGEASPRFTIKGGSFLCGGNYCRRYRAAARQGMEHDFSTAHIGFRIVKDN